MQRYIPKNFEPAEIKKVKLQEKMSGLKHDFSIENESNLLRTSSDANDDESEIDPIDECKKWHSKFWGWPECVILWPWSNSISLSVVLNEIQERIDWLEEMEKLGEGRAYKALIKSEIEERLRAIKRLQPSEAGAKQWFKNFCINQTNDLNWRDSKLFIQKWQRA